MLPPLHYTHLLPPPYSYFSAIMAFGGVRSGLVVRRGAARRGGRAGCEADGAVMRRTDGRGGSKNVGGSAGRGRKVRLGKVVASWDWEGGSETSSETTAAAAGGSGEVGTFCFICLRSSFCRGAVSCCLAE